jgi:glycosyltransferase involved in cell wall biosynthesis
LPRPEAVPLKILTVSSYFDTHKGGVEIVAGRLAQELARQGACVTWAATGEAPPSADGTPVKFLELGGLNLTENYLGFPYPIPGLRGLAAIRAAVAQADAVLLHDALYATSVAAFLFARANRKPVVVIQHIGEVPYRNVLLRTMMTLANTFIARPLLASADQVAFISSFVRNFFRGVRFRRPPELIFNGVDVGVFRPPTDGERPNLRRELGLPDLPTGLFVGRFVEKKGLHILREAAAGRPDVQWVFAGHGPLDPAAWGLPNVKVFSGLAGESLARLYKASDVLVLPSVGEGFPLVIQEALACGLPVICGEETTHADEAARPMLIGLRLDLPIDRIVAGLRDALDTALSRPAASRLDRATFAAERYSWRNAACEYRGLLQSSVSEKQSRI